MPELFTPQFLLTSLIFPAGWLFINWIGKRLDKIDKKIDTDIAKVENEVKILKADRNTDSLAQYKYFFETFTDKESFYRATGEIKGLLDKVFAEIKATRSAVDRHVGDRGGN